jgi:Sap, sulfolipid-1-addressing protein
MSELVMTLIPLAVGSAVVPIQIIITILLLRAPGGRITAVAWVAGMTAIRLLQGLVFGLLLGGRLAEAGGEDGGSSVLVSVVLLVLAILFYVVAAKQLLKHPDDDAPPPKWMAMLDGVAPGRAFLLGVGLVAISAKFWVFTLGAIAAIGDAGLGMSGSIVAFLLFFALAESIHLTAVGFAYAAPARADAGLARFSALLERYNGLIKVVLGLVFGTWFLVKALTGLGVL